jgi:hypothetical protein
MTQVMLAGPKTHKQDQGGVWEVPLKAPSRLATLARAIRGIL